jgi:DNA-binding transcriptional ArsR family regulator
MLEDTLNLTFSALADPTRRAMLARLSKGEASVSDLAKPFLKKMSLPAVTKHVKVLEQAGLISKSRDAQWRPCKLKAEGFREAADWVEQYRVFWEKSFDRLDAYLKETASTRKGKEKKHGTSKE